VVIQQIIASILTFLLCYVCKSQLIEVGYVLGISNDVLAWGVPTFLIIISIWKLSSRTWGLGDAIALIMISTIILLYYYHDVSKIVSEIAKVGLGIGTGVVIGYLIKNQDD